MKKIIVTVVCVALGLTLSAQTKLYVQLMDENEQKEFAIADKPKITFNQVDQKMTVAGQTFELNKVQNLSFTKNNTSEIITITQDNNKITLFPNPVKEELNLNFETVSPEMSYRIYDLSGKQIKKDRIHSVNTQIRMQDFRTGTYVLMVERDGQPIQSFKIVKQ